MTCDLSESFERYNSVNRSTEKLFNSIRKILITGTDTMLTDQQIALLVDNYTQETLSVIREDRAVKRLIDLCQFLMVLNALLGMT